VQSSTGIVSAIFTGKFPFPIGGSLLNSMDSACRFIHPVSTVRSFVKECTDIFNAPICGTARDNTKQTSSAINYQYIYQRDDFGSPCSGKIVFRSYGEIRGPLRPQTVVREFVNEITLRISQPWRRTSTIQ
jgi:hypothetical protein